MSTKVEQNKYYYHPHQPVVDKTSSTEVCEEQVEHGFDEVTKIINVNEFLNDARVTESGVLDLADALYRGKWDSPIFDDKDLFPLLALKAFKENKITMGQFSTVMFYHSIRKHYDREEIVVCSLFEMREELNKTFYPQSLEEGDGLDKISYLSKEQIEHFYTLMKGLPKDQQQFFIIPKLTPNYSSKKERDDGYCRNEKVTVKDSIQFDGGVNVFCDIKYRGKLARMVPSFGMMQAFLDAFSLGDPEGSIQLTPRIGISTLEQFRQQGLSRTRDVGLHFIYSPLPSLADELHCPREFEYSHHDGVYHAMVASRVNKSHQKAFVVAYDILMELNKSSKVFYAKRIIQTLAERCIDMERSEYSPKYYSRIEKQFATKEHLMEFLFWKSLETNLDMTFSRLAQSLIRSDPRTYMGIPDFEKFATELLKKEKVLENFVSKALEDPYLKQFTTLLQTLANKSYTFDIYDHLLAEASLEKSKSSPFYIALGLLQTQNATQSRR